MAFDPKAMKNNLKAKLNSTPGSKGFSRSSGDNAVFPFWDMPNEQNAKTVTRFLPDGDENNFESFWSEKQIMNFVFPYAIGGDKDKEVKLQVPCIEKWSTATNKLWCPVHKVLREWYKDAEKNGNEELKAQASRYWKKSSYVTQAFVRSSSFKEENSPENPIRRFILGSQIFKAMTGPLSEEDCDINPVDFTTGTDFIIRLTKQGTNNNYGTSSWDRKETALTDAELKAIEQFGLFKLSNFTPQRPSDAQMIAIKEMFEASVAGEPYDVERWGQFYKPYGLDISNGNNPLKENVDHQDKYVALPKNIKSEPKIEVKDEVVQPKDTNTLLAELRARAKK